MNKHIVPIASCQRPHALHKLPHKILDHAAPHPCTQSPNIMSSNSSRPSCPDFLTLKLTVLEEKLYTWKSLGSWVRFLGGASFGARHASCFAAVMLQYCATFSIGCSIAETARAESQYIRGRARRLDLRIRPLNRSVRSSAVHLSY